MKVIYGIDKIKKYKNPVVAMGVFDGVHRGHARVLKSAVSIARRIKGTPIVLTFDPHPQKQDSLSSLEHRLRLMGELGIKICIIINFNQAFAKISAQDFIKNILAKKIKARYVCVGSDFKFGKAATGDVGLLKKMSREYNFKLNAVSMIKQGGNWISSSLIRKLIIKGNLRAAEKLLGRPVTILGEVVKGDSLGATLGFPTANVDPHHEVLPPSGVYAVRVVLGKHSFNGACSIGTRPTFFSSGSKKIEVYIFNFSGNIYGKYIEIQFVKKIREQKKFKSPEFLIKEINKDIFKVKKILKIT